MRYFSSWPLQEPQDVGRVSGGRVAHRLLGLALRLLRLLEGPETETAKLVLELEREKKLYNGSAVNA